VYCIRARIINLSLLTSMTKQLASILLSISLLSGISAVWPSVASAVTLEELQAQIDALRAQIEALKTKQAVSPSLELAPSQPSSEPTASVDKPRLTPSGCVALVHNLFIGHTDEDSVIALQKFLIKQSETKWPEGVGATGYFGPITEKAVQRFQAYRGIVSSGDPETTGYGLVGKRTRVLISNMTCGSDLTNPTPPQESIEQSIERPTYQN